MYLQHIGDLQPAQEQAVIINVGTKLVSTLALMSALKHANMPILVIDCESTDGSVEHFTELMQHYRFDLLSAPLQTMALPSIGFSGIYQHKKCCWSTRI